MIFIFVLERQAGTQFPPKHWKLSAELHGITSQKTVVLVCNIVCYGDVLVAVADSGYVICICVGFELHMS
jgi:hypothetical protein